LQQSALRTAKALDPALDGRVHLRMGGNSDINGQNRQVAGAIYCV